VIADTGRDGRGDEDERRHKPILIAVSIRSTGRRMGLRSSPSHRTDLRHLDWPSTCLISSGCSGNAGVLDRSGQNGHSLRWAASMRGMTSNAASVSPEKTCRLTLSCGPAADSWAVLATFQM
jgi:hypothetical protein